MSRELTMDDIDSKQQAAIDQLQEHAKDNRTTDRAQWVTMAVVAVSFLVYINMGLISVLNSQADSLKKVAESCK